MDEYSPLIGQFCGVGSFPVSIIGTSNKLFLEFVTSKYGPLLNTGIIMISGLAGKRDMIQVLTFE